MRLKERLEILERDVEVLREQAARHVLDDNYRTIRRAHGLFRPRPNVIVFAARDSCNPNEWDVYCPGEPDTRWTGEQFRRFFEPADDLVGWPGENETKAT